MLILPLTPFISYFRSLNLNVCKAALKKRAQALARSLFSQTRHVRGKVTASRKHRSRSRGCWPKSRGSFRSRLSKRYRRRRRPEPHLENFLESFASAVRYVRYTPGIQPAQIR